jgi:uncharacterized protein
MTDTSKLVGSEKNGSGQAAAKNMAVSGMMDAAPGEKRLRKIEIVLKVAERCNINCSYCYMFNKGNEEFQSLPAYISQTTIENVAEFLLSGARAYQVESVVIGIHGGEPLMFKKERFVAMCETFIRILGPLVKFGLQTNGMLIDEEWLAIFAKYHIHTGVSIDGPREFNDIARLDHQGRSTYDATVRGIRLLQSPRSHLKTGPGALTVINPALDGRRSYRHMVDELGITNFDFLLPIETHDSFDFSTLPAYGAYLCAAFDEWVKDDNPGIRVRMFSNILAYFVGGKEFASAGNRQLFKNVQLLTVDSDGGIGPDDSLKPLNGGLFNMNIADNSFEDFAGSGLMRDLAAAEESLPSACVDCTWQTYCKGGGHSGRFANRFSARNGFDNPTIFCAALKALYAHVADFLLRTGFPKEKLVDSLDYSERSRISAPATIRGASELGMRRTIPIYAAPATARQ